MRAIVIVFIIDVKDPATVCAQRMVIDTPLATLRTALGCGGQVLDGHHNEEKDGKCDGRINHGLYLSTGQLDDPGNVEDECHLNPRSLGEHGGQSLLREGENHRWPQARISADRGRISMRDISPKNSPD